jgi:hypothetical protein
MSRYLRLIAFCAGVLATAGCSDERRLPTEPAPPAPVPTGPTAPSPPRPPPDPQRLAALALFESASLHAGLTTSPLTHASEDGHVLFNGPCVFESGSLQGSLDGGLSPIPGAFLPTGSHTYAVSFTNCLTRWWGEILHGVASVAYSADDWSNVTARVSADSVRGQGLPTGEFSQLYDVTADGSAVWTRVGSTTTTYTPATGSRLIDNSTANVATFGGGSFSTVRTSNRVERRFDDLKVAINGTEYTLDGSPATTIGSDMRGTPSYIGEIRIINDGTLVARIYGDVRMALTVEVLVPLIPL